MDRPVVYQVAAPSRPLSRWWPIGFEIASLIFFIIGGALLGESSSYFDCYDFYYCDDGTFYGGIACLAVGGALQITAWILWIVFCTRRRRAVDYNTTSYAPTPVAMNDPYVKPQPPVVAPQPVPPSRSTTPGFSEYQQASFQTGAKYCGHCGTPVTTPFCTQCGARETG